MNMAAWDACGNRDLRREDLAGKQAFVTLDAAFKKDLFAKIVTVPDGKRVKVFSLCYCSEAFLERKGMEQLRGWVNEGWIKTTPGEVLDIEIVRQDLQADLAHFDVVEVGFDPWALSQFAGEMMAEGAPMVEVRANVQNFSEPMKRLDELVAARQLEHQADPALAWMISNVVCHRDVKDNIYPRKEREESKIDAAVGLIMNIGRAFAPREDDAEPMIVVLG
jgi:phage terminase large subunit-like protein